MIKESVTSNNTHRQTGQKTILNFHAEIFSTQVGNIEGDSQKYQTIKDLIIKIRDNAISDYQLRNATDGNAIMKTIKDRKALDEFKHKELNLY